MEAGEPLVVDDDSVWYSDRLEWPSVIRVLGPKVSGVYPSILYRIEFLSSSGLEFREAMVQVDDIVTFYRLLLP